MKIIILAGGGGTRLFPLSRSAFPKQFLAVEGQQSLLVKTIDRFLPLVKPADIIVVTNEQYFYHVQNELSECGADTAHIILEPVGRNTAPAIGLAVKYCLDKLACSEDEVLLVTPADHVIRDYERFECCIREGEVKAKEQQLVTFGIQPDKPETGYGYIEAGEKLGSGYKVASFKEKPPLATAEAYLAAGNYYWNSGMFAFSAGLMLQEFAVYAPEVSAGLNGYYEEVLQAFASMPNISIDYAVAEKSKHVVMIPLDCYWNDVGSWDAMYDILPKDAQGNAMRGDCLAIDCSNSLLMGRDRLVAGIGIDDLLLVETDDVIVVAKKGESQKVKSLVEELQQRGRKEATEHTTVYRPWGTYTMLGAGPHYRMRKIKVKPQSGMQMHMHCHRTEHWVVLSGTARVIIDGKEMWIHESESAFVPQTAKHRLENPGKIPLEIIEIQNGSYIGEDDMVWFKEK